MSVAAVAKVWERSKAKGGELLVLLAVADYAHDDGRDAWPTIERLAAKSRMSDRGVRDILQRLVADGELAVEKNADGRLVRGYRPRQFLHVLCCADEPAKIAGGEPAKIAASTGKDCREQPAKIAASTGKDCREQPAKIAASTGRIPYDEPAESRTAYKEDPLRDPLGSVCTHTQTDSTPATPVWSLESFERLWSVYPRKERREAALEAWHALRLSQELARFIVLHVQLRVRSGWMRDVPLRFVPMLHTFLSERRWNEQEHYGAPAAAANIWTELVERIRVTFDDHRERIYFDGVSVVEDTTSRVVVVAPTADRLRRDYGARLAEILGAMRPGAVLEILDDAPPAAMGGAA